MNSKTQAGVALLRSEAANVVAGATDAELARMCEIVRGAGRLPLHVVAPGLTKNGATLASGTVVGYCGHLPGGNVSIQLADGTKDVAHPHCFEELR